MTGTTAALETPLPHAEASTGTISRPAAPPTRSDSATLRRPESAHNGDYGASRVFHGAS